MPQFIYQFLPGDRPELATDPESWTEADEAIAARHYSYLQAAAESEILVVAGRAQDGKGPAIVVIDVGDLTEASEFMENDPFVASGLFQARIHPFRVALSRNEV